MDELAVFAAAASAAANAAPAAPPRAPCENVTDQRTARFLARCSAARARTLATCEVEVPAGRKSGPIIYWHIANNGASYAHIPKSGSDTLWRVVANDLGGGTHNSHPTKRMRAFVRDPISRFVSAFKEVTLARGYGGRSPSYWLRNVGQLQTFFDAFCERFFSGQIMNVNTIDSHFARQTSILCGSTGRCPHFDYIGLTANMSLELKILHRKRLCSKRVANSRPSGDTVNVITVAARFLPPLCATYRDDFCCLGFSPPPECGDLCSQNRSRGLGYSWLRR